MVPSGALYGRGTIIPPTELTSSSAAMNFFDYFDIHEMMVWDMLNALKLVSNNR